MDTTTVLVGVLTNAPFYKTATPNTSLVLISARKFQENVYLFNYPTILLLPSALFDHYPM
jgi:hypothetical protein